MIALSVQFKPKGVNSQSRHLMYGNASLAYVQSDSNGKRKMFYESNAVLSVTKRKFIVIKTTTTL